jgi:hypothetical protein
MTRLTKQERKKVREVRAAVRRRARIVIVQPAVVRELLAEASKLEDEAVLLRRTAREIMVRVSLGADRGE